MATGAEYEVVDVSSGEEITNPGANDVMVAFHKSTGALEKIDYNKLAKAIIEQYTGSTIGGAARSVKAALDVTAQSKIVDLDSVAADLTVVGVYYCGRWADNPSGEAASGYVINIPHATNANLRQQFYIPYATEVVYIRGKFDSTGFTDWVKQPTRAEVNTLNNATVVKNMPSPADFNNYTETSVWRCDLLETNVTNGPPVGTYISGFLFVSKYNPNNIIQRFCSAGSSKNELIRFNWSGTWSDWVKQPTRDEISLIEQGVYTGIKTYNKQLYISTDDASYTGIASIVRNIMNSPNCSNRWVTVRVNPSTSAPRVEPFFGSSFNLMINCSSKNYGWGIMMSDNSKSGMFFGQLNDGEWVWNKLTNTQTYSSTVSFRDAVGTPDSTYGDAKIADDIKANGVANYMNKINTINSGGLYTFIISGNTDTYFSIFMFSYNTTYTSRWTYRNGNYHVSKTYDQQGMFS